VRLAKFIPTPRAAGKKLRTILIVAQNRSRDGTFFPKNTKIYFLLNSICLKLCISICEYMQFYPTMEKAIPKTTV
jgi:hypothetical protein